MGLRKRPLLRDLRFVPGVAGAAAGQTVPHVHVHVIPRYAGDMPDPRGGVRHVIPDKGNYLVAQEAPGGSRGTPGAQATHPSMQIVDRPTAGSPSASAPASLGTAPGRYTRMRKFHPSVKSSRFGTSPHSSLEPKYTVKAPSWFSFTLDESMQYEYWMRRLSTIGKP